MNCEPNYNLPQKITLESFRESETAENKVENTAETQDDEDDEKVVHKVSYVQKEYNLLPVFCDQFDHLDEKLSLNKNNYLLQRWHQFLDNVPEDYVRIRLYMDHKKTLEKRVVRPMRLNGQFYGIDNKLAPIPQLSDPRKMETKNK